MIQVSLKSIHPPMLKEKQIGFNFYIVHFCDNCVCSTILVEPHCTAYITKSGDIRIEVIVLYLSIFLYFEYNFPMDEFALENNFLL